MTKCNIDKAQLILYLYGELAGQEKSGFEKHLGECPECRAEAADYRRIMDKLSKLPVMEPSEAAPIRLPYPKSIIMRFATYSTVAASLLLLAVFTYIKLSGTSAPVRTPDNTINITVSTSIDKELYAWDNGVGDEIDSLKESAKTIVNELKASPLASLDDSLDKIDTAIKTISTETD
ncbi:MAG: zf-HC2 domain-containing protein [Planctomycetes bacterium]|nr:zf-HC2 domain-containing protein [Planctomycetota bacterium]